MKNRQIKAIEYLKKNKKITNKNYQKLNNISREMASIDFKKLAEPNIIVLSVSKGAGDYYTLK